jgi:hypothetical protein
VKALAVQGKGSPVTITAIATHLGLDKGTVSRRVKAAVDSGYLENLAPPYRAAQIVVTANSLPADGKLLPTAAELEAALAPVAGVELPSDAGDFSASATACSTSNGGDPCGPLCQ